MVRGIELLKKVYVLAILLVLLLLAIANILPTARGQGEEWELLWSDPRPAIDVAISADGGYIVVGTSENIILYSKEGDILWSWPPRGGLLFAAVDISDDGSAVAGIAYNFSGNSLMVYFWKNANTLSGTPDPTWVSENLTSEETFSAYETCGKCLALSSSGNHLVVGVMNVTDRDYPISYILFWNNTLNIPSGSKDLAPIWNSEPLSGTLVGVDVSDSGEEAVTGVNLPNLGGTQIIFINNLNAKPNLLLNSYGSYVCSGVAISGDGKHYAAALSGTIIAAYSSGKQGIMWSSTIESDAEDGYVFYFNESGLQWASTELYGGIIDVDISGDGETVIAGSNVYPLSPAGFYVFENVASIYYTTDPYIVSPSYVFTDFEYDDDILDVAMDSTGSVLVFGTGKSVYFLTHETELVWVYHGGDYTVSDVVEVAKNGRYVATCGNGVDSVYLFSKPPTVTPSAVGGELEKGKVPSPSLEVCFAILAVCLVAIAIIYREKA